MSQPVIRLENVSKLYRIGEMGTGTISNDFSRWWSKTVKGKDPFAKIGQENKEREGDFWALKDINFEVNQGDVLGIIGKNGAGKSTLLKILSRITSPTTGQVKVKGRIASLLEVGTGFHPELTGRDNVYLNGSFLGMKKWEIDKRFDEIVDFSGIEKFIDTPVKRYSSGMYVRLAFAVAAHLDPEILIIDEVLAVGDAEFQKKCLGKMKSVSNEEGRTVLFVSHDIGSINKLCSKGLYLKSGVVSTNDKIEKVVHDYLYSDHNKEIEFAEQSNYQMIKNIFIFDCEKKEKTTRFYRHTEVQIQIQFSTPEKGIYIGIAFKNEKKEKLFTTIEEITSLGDQSIILNIPKVFFSGHYTIDCAIFRLNGQTFEYLEDIISFSVLDLTSDLTGYENAKIGFLNIECEWLK